MDHTHPLNFFRTEQAELDLGYGPKRSLGIGEVDVRHDERPRVNERNTRQRKSVGSGNMTALEVERNKMLAAYPVFPK